jgi:hypothetical protein
MERCFFALSVTESPRGDLYLLVGEEGGRVVRITVFRYPTVNVNVCTPFHTPTRTSIYISPVSSKKILFNINDTDGFPGSCLQFIIPSSVCIIYTVTVQRTALFCLV